ncbi:response regulator [Kaistia nematophila]|uniref:Response regulator transcription factor n=1 Tax=Kaistia nematophila TaxID=2994654 RepID=A0A9X3EC11_9HYPH|nr:response regulator transcription factor [Kaistia nematophila]MBN9025697.1 response regulator transcription factor [Hyphomicrobiales bacterium]MBN9059135.1 response regulator transcription factor [Hyphomicrobiales bacterium]MCX5570085.1 response regulator transcription factor [Kaistia nematophila]
MRLLLVEDSARLRDLLIETIHQAEWRVDAVATVADARAAMDVAPYDLVLVDLGLPDGDGLELIRSIRVAGFAVPVLIITARGAVDERIAGLDAGADDYLVKPFNHYELLARCRALLRRAPAHMADLIELGHIRFDPASSALSCAGETIAMSPRERSVMAVLLRNAGSVVPKERIEAKLSEFGDELSANAIELAVSRLRKRLEGVASGVAIETVRGAGYLLRDLKNG